MMRRNGLWKRVATAAACTAVVAMGLTGCKVAVSEEMQTTAETTAVTEAAGGTEVPEKKTIEKYGKTLDNIDLDGTLHGQYAGQTLTVPVMSGDFEKAVSDVVPLFEELSGAKVVVESIPGEQFTDKLQLDLNNTKRYDVVLAPIAFLHSFAKADKIEPLDAMISEYAGESYDTSDFLPEL